VYKEEELIWTLEPSALFAHHEMIGTYKNIVGIIGRKEPFYLFYANKLSYYSFIPLIPARY